MIKPNLIVLFIFSLFYIYSCSSDKQTPDRKTTFGDKIEVQNVWVRAAAENANSAGYMDILNGTEKSDTLMAVETEGVSKSEVHESYTTENGLSGMRPVENLTIPPGSALKLQPGSYHLMLMDLKRELRPGDSLQISLQFAQAGTLTKMAEVRD